ncbi:XF1762 family protein [Paractinoplanes rhizophilus]|uniref:XF1762 family protein n=1 Tax=Paractinoplanes rhizophilus TaxID=1416877 RepID=A0ABW2HT27_9ACTN
MTLALVPVSFADACAFVAAWHRHHEPPAGHKFSIGVARDQTLVGVAIVGRPVARPFDDGSTLEVTRCATDGTPNAASMLYAVAWRAASALGYRRLVTYTQRGESGASLRAAGWRVIAERPPRPGWNVPSRPRDARGTANVQRYLWEAVSPRSDVAALTPQAREDCPFCMTGLASHCPRHRDEQNLIDPPRAGSSRLTSGETPA